MIDLNNSPKPGDIFFEPELVTIAGIPLPKWGSLLRKESKWFANREGAGTKGMMEMMLIARELSAVNNIDPTQAFFIVSGFGSENGSELLVPYADRLEPLLDVISYSETTPQDAVTMILRSRLDHNWLRNNATKLKNLLKIDLFGDLKAAFSDADDDFVNKYEFEWLDAYTERLPEATIEELWQFIQNEKRMWKVDPAEPAKTIKQEGEGLNLGEESSSTENISQSTTNGTGETSTSPSNSAPLTTPVTTPTILKKIPATFSSKPQSESTTT
jgi:hypothetical protein